MTEVEVNSFAASLASQIGDTEVNKSWKTNTINLFNPDNELENDRILEFRAPLEVIREHSFSRKGGGPKEFRGGSLTFCLPKKEGSAWIWLNNEVGHYKFYCFPGRVTCFNTKYKGRPGRFYAHAHNDASGQPPPPPSLLKNEFSLMIV